MQKIPLNLKWRAGITPPPNTNPMGDPGAEMARAFVRGLDGISKPPRVEIPRPTKSQDELYWQDVMNNTAPIPSFGVQDTRPQTQGDLQALYNPVMITDAEPIKPNIL